MFSNPSRKLKNIAAFLFAMQILLLFGLVVCAIVAESIVIFIAAAILFFTAWYNTISILTMCDAADYAQQAVQQTADCIKDLRFIRSVLEEKSPEEIPTWKKVAQQNLQNP